MHFKINISIFMLCFLVIHSTNYASTISDSLVEGLDCSNLSQEKIYQKIRPEAFSSYFHLPLPNWSFSAGPYDLAACWSLAHAQRFFFYLARWDAQNSGHVSDQIFHTLELLRGSSPYAHASDENIYEFPLKDVPVIQFREHTWILSSHFWRSLEKGVEQSFANNQKLFRNLKTEIEFYQKRRFNDFLRNIKYIIGDGSRSIKQNQKTREQILQSLEANSLPSLQRSSAHLQCY